MPQITDLNVAPYYDDFDKEDNFHRVLFRPGFAIQGRELTTLQSILQNQVERFGRHMFQEGSVVVPGQVTFSSQVTYVSLESTFADETLVLSQYYNVANPVIITGATSGVQAKVIGFQDATATTQPILLIQYINSGSDSETLTFSDNENISANISITHNTTYGAAIASATSFLLAKYAGPFTKPSLGAGSPVAPVTVSPAGGCVSAPVVVCVVSTPATPVSVGPTGNVKNGNLAFIAACSSGVEA